MCAAFASSGYLPVLGLVLYVADTLPLISERAGGRAERAPAAVLALLDAEGDSGLRRSDGDPGGAGHTGDSRDEGVGRRINH